MVLQIDLQVLDINDNAPQFVDAQRVAYIVKAGAQAAQQIGENFELTDADLDIPATHMSVRLKGEQYLGCTNQESCDGSGPYFKVSDANNYDQLNGKASFTITERVYRIKIDRKSTGSSPEVDRKPAKDRKTDPALRRK